MQVINKTFFNVSDTESPKSHPLNPISWNFSEHTTMSMLELSIPATSAFLPQFHLETKYKQGLNPQQSTALAHTQRLTAFFVKDQIASVLGSAGYTMSLHGFFSPFVTTL